MTEKERGRADLDQGETGLRRQLHGRLESRLCECVCVVFVFYF